MPHDLAFVHVALIVAMILLLGMEEHDEHGHWHR